MRIFHREPTPVRLYKKQTFREKHEEDIIITLGILLIIFLFFFAFFVIGPMDPYYNGGLV